MTNIELPEPDFTSYQVDSVMRRNELRSFSASQMRAMFEAGAARAEKLEAFFREVVELTLNHDVLSWGDDEDSAVVYPSKLGEALERVDANWAAIKKEPK